MNTTENSNIITTDNMVSTNEEFNSIQSNQNEVIDTKEPVQQENPPTIIIDNRPSVSFGEFDTVFDSDNPQASDMIYEPKDEEEDEVPALEILDEQGTPLAEGFDFDNLDEKQNDEMEIDDYESLS